ncbi:pentapeptide repeat-containing protein, partial [Streptomyces sp. NPDC000927]|uniref:pentapeptide repeat-containing protein n=1 Tax=Streptomyces sp. NPDC000927 TaxID=3154371 RepID=UPI00333032B7
MYRDVDNRHGGSLSRKAVVAQLNDAVSLLDTCTYTEATGREPFSEAPSETSSGRILSASHFAHRSAFAHRVGSHRASVAPDSLQHALQYCGLGGRTCNQSASFNRPSGMPRPSPEPSSTPPLWPHCGHGATPEARVGCCGIRVPGHSACLAHLADADRHAYLAGLAPGTNVDHRGTTFTGPLLDALLDALYDPATGQPHLGDACFHSTTFQGNASFRSVAFAGDTSFQSATCQSNAWFGSAMFHGTSDFASASFEGDVTFDSAVFQGNPFEIEPGVNFSMATFRGNAKFESVTFGCPISFSSATFKRIAWFRSTTFYGTSDFELADFEGDAWFESATFRRDAQFESASFEGDAWFELADFEGNAWFESVTFQGDAQFKSATFQGDAWFELADFEGNAWFESVTFQGDAQFKSAT